MSELKACPFCGGVDIRINHGPSYAECNTCGAYGPSSKMRGTRDEVRAETISLWNGLRADCVYCGLSERAEKAEAENARLRGELDKVVADSTAAINALSAQSVQLVDENARLRSGVAAMQFHVEEAERNLQKFIKSNA